MIDGKRVVTTMGILALGLTGVPAWGQGSLTPPGPPGSTMRTLEQVEPRIPLSNGTRLITEPGSYYLTGNMTETVVIDADYVTLDLMGFEIAPAASNAIYIVAGKGKHTVVRNGDIRMAPISAAVDGRHIVHGNSRFEDLRIDGQRKAIYGIIAGSGCLVRNCHVFDCASCGISGNSTNGGLEVRDCRVSGTGVDGMAVYKESRVIDNVIEDNRGSGLIVAGAGTYVSGNIVRGNGDNYELASSNQLNLLISEIPELIEWPCSVKLAGTLICTQTDTNGLTINADDVTIDMAGHTLVGPGASSGHGIGQASSNRNLRVFNGKVVNWRGSWSAGVSARGLGSNLSDIQASTNYYGISTGPGCLLRDSVAANNTSIGIRVDENSVVNRCVARYNGDTGITNGTASAIADCTAFHNGGHGISTDGCCLVHDCIAYANSVDGIRITRNCRVSGCACSLNGFTTLDAAGIHATDCGNRIEGNTVCNNYPRGIDVDAALNILLRNGVGGNPLNWDVAIGNVCLVVKAATGGAISGDAGGVAPGSTDPSVNFTY